MKDDYKYYIEIIKPIEKKYINTCKLLNFFNFNFLRKKKLIFYYKILISYYKTLHNNPKAIHNLEKKFSK